MEAERMQALQRTWQMISSQLQGLTPTARMLLGSLMIILVMALFLVSLYAGRRPLVPLGLNANIGAEARARAVTYLKSNKIAHEVSGTELLVPADQKYSVLAYLTETQIIGADQINFDRLMSDDNLFRTRDQDRRRFLVAKMNVLSGMISQMTGIERAAVVIDASETGTGVGRAHVPPSASVNVLPRGTELSQAQVDAIARLVAGSHAGLKPQNVAVIDARTGRAMQVRSDDLVNAGKYLEVKLEAERHVRATLENALGYIPGVRIAVNALVDTKQVVQQTTKHDDPKIGILEETSHSITSNSGGGGAEPGVRSNTGASIAAASRATSQLSDERTQTSSIPIVGTTASQIRDSKGYALQINASIGVPKSYFVRVFQDQQGDAGKQPSTQELDALVQIETDRIRSMIKPLIDTQAMEGAVAGAVAVSMIPDFGSIPASAFELRPADVLLAGGSAVGSPVGGLLSEETVRLITLGVLGLVSVAIMFLMVRKASPRGQFPSAAELAGIPPALSASDTDLVGEADEASPALEGVELDDEAISRQQMLEQISDMINSTPDEAAHLLRRWMRADA